VRRTPWTLLMLSDTGVALGTLQEVEDEPRVIWFIEMCCVPPVFTSSSESWPRA